MAVLDELSGVEFKDVMEDVFRSLGYENVRQARRTADEGRDVIMEEVLDGTRRAVVVECKHTDTVGRPVVQKLHSAAATFGFDGPTRGIVVTTVAETDAVFETSVGVIHRIDDRTQLVVHAERGRPSVADREVARLIADNLHATVELAEDRFRGAFDEIDRRRFGQTQTEYKEWAIDRLREYHTTTVTYTGDNNVSYTKTCEPNQSDISVQSIEPVYLPEIRQTTKLGEYTYPYEYHAAGPSRVTVEDGIHLCPLRDNRHRRDLHLLS